MDNNIICVKLLHKKFFYFFTYKKLFHIDGENCYTASWMNRPINVRDNNKT